VDLSEAIATLRQFNAWRRGFEPIDQPEPRDITVAIYAICDHAERLEREVAVWKHSAKILEEELKSEHEKAIEWFIAAQEAKNRTNQ